MGYIPGVSLLGGQSLRKSYGDRDILRGASVTIANGERLGLVAGPEQVEDARGPRDFDTDFSQ